MAMIIGVRFREVGRVYYFDPGDIQVEKGTCVIVETARGVECGEVVQENTDVPDDQIKHPLKQMIRVATPDDLKNLEGKAQKEADAFKICEEKILKHELDMKLVNVEYTFDGSKIIFHFTADQRVDFRALVRDLAGQFRTRIELRQIGVRDEAKLLGGLGVCGRPFCCSLFMGEFHPVSIKMAKEQGLSLNPTKISGTCGRLMCCLKYEEAAYEDAMKDLPRPGSYVDTPDGRGMVMEVNAVSRAVKVKLERRPDAAPQVFQHSTEEGLKRKAVQRENEFMPDFSLLQELEQKKEAAREQPQKPQQPRRQQQPRQQQPRQQQPRQQQKQQPRQQKQQPRPQGEKAAAPNKDAKGKNWRERHVPKKQETAAPPQPKQQPNQQPKQQPKQKPPQRAPQQKPKKQQQQVHDQPEQARTDANAVPRYGEVRRANAPQPPRPPGGTGYQRQPWQKRNNKKKPPKE